MTPGHTSRRLTIFEGPDGGGKTTTAKAYALATNARYIHFGPFERVPAGQLARMFVEAMTPALHGYQDVVFDRCWVSDPIYAVVHRAGRHRLDHGQVSVLERLAMRCDPHIVFCLPSFDVCRGHFNSRRAEEMLENDRALRRVYDLYRQSAKATYAGRPYASVYDYTAQERLVTTLRPLDDGLLHNLDVASAGYLKAPNLIVGDSFADHTAFDPLYQWPFGSLGGGGSSQWLANYLAEHKVPEHTLLWVNTDQPSWALQDLVNGKNVFALGSAARSILEKLDLSRVRRFECLAHPQRHRSFEAGGGEYQLAKFIKENVA